VRFARFNARGTEFLKVHAMASGVIHAFPRTEFLGSAPIFSSINLIPRGAFGRRGRSAEDGGDWKGMMGRMEREEQIGKTGSKGSGAQEGQTAR
jgi:hypothetical protein